LFPIAAILAQNYSPEYGLLLPIFGLFNATLHILMLLIKRKYNPGVWVSIFVNYPTGIYTLYVLAHCGFIHLMSLTIALLVTFFSHVLMIGLVMRNRRHTAH
jgi:hypothetical protein